MGQGGLSALATGFQRRAKLIGPHPSETPPRGAEGRETCPTPLSADVQAGEQGAVPGIRGLMHARNLSLSLSGGPMTPVPLRRLSLGASEGEVGEGALDGLWAAVLPGIEELELWCGGSGAMMMTGLAIGLAQTEASRLTVLRVRGERDEVVGGMDLLLGKVGPGLRTLELHRCAVSAEAVGLVVGGSGALETLRMQECWLACVHVAALATALGKPTAAGPAVKVRKLISHILRHLGCIFECSEVEIYTHWG